MNKRSAAEALSDTQSGNQTWWTDNTMSYDWKERIDLPRFSAEWFEDADRRFIIGAGLFAHEQSPFDRIIPFAALQGKRVLEIGCGMGLHTELMLRAGANVTSIDLSPTSVEATSRRLSLKGLNGDVRNMDAEKLEFPDQTFDLVWSWGVIHHSSRTGRVIRELHRVLKPGGETRVMVYHLGGMPAYIIMMMKYSWAFWRGKSLDELLWAHSDGYTARYYTKDSLADIFGIFFDDVRVETFGQPADAVPLPRQIRGAVAKLMSREKQQRLGNARGSLIFAIAQKTQERIE